MSYTRAQAKESVGQGWSKLIDRVFDNLPEDITITQVKEKFGGLRIYCDLSPHDHMYEIPDIRKFRNFLSRIENESFKICEVCGESGKPRNDLPWVKTLCDFHYAERVK